MRSAGEEESLRDRLRKIIPLAFFNQPTFKVAQELLGKFLVRKIGKRIKAAMITEVEAYVGPKDRASHASRGLTPRNEIMFGKPGFWYVYLIYGMHCCLNVVTEKKGYPAAVLIRSVKVPISYSNVLKNIGIDEMRGPGRVCKYFQIDRTLNAKPADKKTGLWIEDRGVRIPKNAIGRGKRIGVKYAGRWKDKPWRLSLVSDKCIS